MKAEQMRGSSMKFGRFGNTYVCVHPSFAPTDEDWKAWIADIEPQSKELSGLFVYAQGSGGPNAVQRKMVADMWNRVGRVPPIALVSDSPVIRAMTTALNYVLSRPIRGFSPDAIDKALEHVGVPAPERQVIRDLIAPALSSIKPRLRAG